jgi:hypothetical protein
MSPDCLRLRRLVRALLRQRGGAMLSALPASGIAVRIECAVGAGRAAVAVGGAGFPGALTAEARGAITAECARAGVSLADLRWNDRRALDADRPAPDAPAPRDTAALLELPRAA